MSEDAALVSLAAASTALVGTHFALSHPLRRPLTSALGQGGFTILYSLVAFACIGWMYLAFRAAPAADLPGSGEAGWLIASLLTLPALVLFLGSLRRNPAFPGAGSSRFAAAPPQGVFRISRHPMMWGFALWAVSHLVLLWSWRTTLVAGAILVLALVGARLQDRKKAALIGAEWQAWEARTSYFPRLSQLGQPGIGLWLLALAAWLGITWWHIQAGGIPAGVWRWLG